jgi:hypothetical protein
VVASHLSQVEDLVAEKAFPGLPVAHHHQEAYFVCRVFLEETEGLAGDECVVGVLGVGDELDELSLLGGDVLGQLGFIIDAEGALHI